MKRTVLLFIVSICLLFWDCKKEEDKSFLISSESVGLINKNTAMEEIEVLYQKDSVVVDSSLTALGQKADRISIYEKGGKPLLLIKGSNDSLQPISNIRVLDNRFQTAEGIGLYSTFKDIREAFAIKKIVTSINNVVVFPEGSDVYFTIDKEELPANIRYSGSEVEEVQIPEKARLKYLMVGWD